MDGGYIIREERHLTVERYGTINEEQDTTPRAPTDSERKCADVFLILLIYTIGIGNIVLGAIYINYCPAQKMLPIGIVAFGGIWVVGRLLNSVHDYRNLFKDSEDTPNWLVWLNISFVLAGFGMLIALCYWIATISPTTKPEDHALKNYCAPKFLYTCTGECAIIVIYLVSCVCGCRCC